MAQPTRLMDSFSQRDRFIWRDDDFHVIIPNGTRTACYARASPSFLKALLIPQLRLTRGGNISQHQPAPPPPQPYDFYLAQLIHYGLDFHFDIEAAQCALEIEIRLGRLRVPPGLVKLEKELRREHNREQKKLHAQVVRYSEKPPRGSNVEAATSVDTSDAGSKVEKTQRPATRKSEKRKKHEVLENGSQEKGEASSIDERSSGSQGDSSDENDTIAVAQETRNSTSSSGSSSSSSSPSPSPSPARSAKAEEEVKRSDSTPSSDCSSESEASEKSDKEDSGDDDPFLDRHDVKRIKLEQADEHKDSILRSTREAAPFVVRKQLPPSQAKVRRIASKPQISTPSGNLGKTTSSTTPDGLSKIPAMKPFVSPDKRPSWTIPVRSPSSAQKDTTPKSVTFSQVQRETPTKVPHAEKATFSSALKTPQASPQRTPSFSSDRSHGTPLRSILKRAPSNLDQSPASAFSSQAETPVQIPREEDGHHAKRRRRKRKSSSEVAFDDTQHSLHTWDGLNEEKPFVTSDIVDGKPVSVLSLKGSHFTHGSSRYGNDSAQSLDRSNGDTGFVGINSNAFNQNHRHAHQQQQQHEEQSDADPIKTRAHESDSMSFPGTGATGKHKHKNMHTSVPFALDSAAQAHSTPSPRTLKPSAKKISKSSSLKSKDSPANGLHQHQHIRSRDVNGVGSGSGSRGSLVRAGGVY